ncbi:MAG: peptidyl-prolyl cis-trans isomerase [Deltaproteobacteria bacterium]|nr:peptidyl-prolyl cis-trans isomerase [Deltaproteobacteria bacterium]
MVVLPSARWLRRSLSPGATAALLSLALLAGGCPEGSEGKAPADPVVASVSGQEVPASELARLMDRFRQEHGDLAFRSDSDRVQVRDQLLKDRIQELLLLQAAEARKIEISEEKIDRAMMRLRAGYPERSFEEHLAEEGLPESQVRRDLRDRLMIRELLRTEVNARVAVSEQEIETYFQENEKKLERPEEVRASQIVVRTEEEAQRIRRDLQRGEDFAELARQHSVAPEAASGGDLGFFARGIMPNPIDSSCFSLGTGKVSEVVESPYGYHLFMVHERRGAEARKLDDALREKIELELRQEKEAAAQQRFIEELQKAAKITIDDTRLAEVH